MTSTVLVRRRKHDHSPSTMLGILIALFNIYVKVAIGVRLRRRTHTSTALPYVRYSVGTPNYIQCLGPQEKHHYSLPPLH